MSNGYSIGCIVEVSRSPYGVKVTRAKHDEGDIQVKGLSIAFHLYYIMVMLDVAIREREQ